jgi:lon-related putative ATP-dependent protease
MPSVSPLPSEELCRVCDPNQFQFETTAELEELNEVFGQKRAVEAVEFGVGILREGYNVFCLGPSGVGKHFIVRHQLERRAAGEPLPPDWCYINNFEEPQRPLLLQLPAGEGAELRADMEQLVDELRAAIPAAFESDEYSTRKQVIISEMKDLHEKAMEVVRVKAGEKHLGLLRTPTGFVFAPVKGDEVMGPEEYDQLPEDQRQNLEQAVEALEEELQKALREAPKWEKQSREKLKVLNREVTNFAVGHSIEELRKKYGSFPEVIKHLNAIEQDVIENVEEFLKPPENPIANLMGFSGHKVSKSSPFFRRYLLNLLIEHKSNHGAPVIYEDNPTYQNLTGQVEYTAQLGALITDFNLIRPGALHRANGGYLILDARKLLSQPYAWEGLKRVLFSGEVRIESLGEMLGALNTITLEPERIPLKVKVILMGDRSLYYLLSQHDPEFVELFKVAADFEEDIDRTDDNTRLYARLIGSLARQEKLLDLDKGAVARVIQQSIRTAGDAEKLSTYSRTLLDLLGEADYWAHQNKHSIICCEDVEQAIHMQIRRQDRVRERYQEQVLRGTVLIDTDSEKVGQVNGLSVVSLGQFAFGHPTRITARVRLGRGEVVDIEREVELGGPIHSKGVLILSSFLGARYASNRPLSLSASLVFEQSYGGVEGDSASSAELYALLSALADAPIKQCFAVTGSVNQHGQVQAIGGVNEKIEGFFDLCRARGLTGSHGVLIPISNVKHLMVRQDVVEAVKDGKFNIYPIETIDQGIELLTGISAGERDASGKFPEGSLNARVESQLIHLAEERKNFSSPTKEERTS